MTRIISFTIITFNCFFSCVFSQEKLNNKYVIELTKDDKDKKIIKENQKIVFALGNDTIEKKGTVIKIKIDTIFILEKNLHTSIGYNIKEIKMIGYIQPSSIATTITYFVAMGILSGLGGYQAVPAANTIKPVKFKEKINIDKGWTVKIVPSQ